MKYTIKDNNGNLICSVESNDPVNDEVSLESVTNSIYSTSKELSNSLDKLNLVFDTRAMESFGYRSIESDDAKAAKENIFKRMWDKIQAFFKRIGDFFKGVFEKISKKISDANAKRAANAVLKKLEVPKDKTDDNAMNRIIEIIRSSNMGLYVVLSKNYNQLMKIKGFIMEEPNMKAKDVLKSQINANKAFIANWEKEAEKVSEGEKLRAAKKFYADMASTGVEKITDSLNKELKDLETVKTKVTKVYNDLKTTDLAGQVKDETTNIVIARYTVITALYGVLTKYISTITSLSVAAIGVKNSVINEQTKD